MQTREEWLNNAVDLFRRHFKENNVSLPRKIFVSVGWTSFGMNSNVVAESWQKSVSRDRGNHIFISPELFNPIEVLSTLCHELVHVSMNCEDGHGPEYQRRAKLVGMEAPWIGTNATRALRNILQEWCKTLGSFPHGGFKKHYYKQPATKNYWTKISCPGCGYLARTSVKWIKTGLPTCHCGTQMIEG